MSEKLQAPSSVLNAVVSVDDAHIRQFHPELIQRMDVEGADGWECVEIVGCFDSHGNYLLKRGYEQGIKWLDHENDMAHNWLEYYYCFYCGDWWSVENTPQGWKQIERWMMEDSCDNTILCCDLPWVGCWLENELELDDSDYRGRMLEMIHEVNQSAADGYDAFTDLDTAIESDPEVLQLVQEQYGDVFGVIGQLNAAEPINHPVTV